MIKIKSNKIMTSFEICFLFLLFAFSIIPSPLCAHSDFCKTALQVLESHSDNWVRAGILELAPDWKLSPNTTPSEAQKQFSSHLSKHLDAVIKQSGLRSLDELTGSCKKQNPEASDGMATAFELAAILHNATLHAIYWQFDLFEKHFESNPNILSSLQRIHNHLKDLISKNIKLLSPPEITKLANEIRSGVVGKKIVEEMTAASFNTRSADQEYEHALKKLDEEINNQAPNSKPSLEMRSPLEIFNRVSMNPDAINSIHTEVKEYCRVNRCYSREYYVDVINRNRNKKDDELDIRNRESIATEANAELAVLMFDYFNEHLFFETILKTTHDDRYLDLSKRILMKTINESFLTALGLLSEPRSPLEIQESYKNILRLRTGDETPSISIGEIDQITTTWHHLNALLQKLIADYKQAIAKL